MNTQPTSPIPGQYQYSYPTFIDTPQYICVHFLTPDAQQAFVSYPHHPNRKAAQLIPVSWFSSVIITKIDGQPGLLDFIETLLTGWFDDTSSNRSSNDVSSTHWYQNRVDERLAA